MAQNKFPNLDQEFPGAGGPLGARGQGLCEKHHYDFFWDLAKKAYDVNRQSR